MNPGRSVVILGAGVGGLSVGWLLAERGWNVTVLESSLEIGGMCGSFKKWGSTLDYGAHKSYSVIPGVLDELVRLMGAEFLTRGKRNRIRLRGHFLDYPLRISELARVLGIGLCAQLSMGSLSAMLAAPFRGEPLTYEEYIIQKFGRATYELVFKPLADKVWGEPATISADIARARIPARGALDLVARLLGLKKESATTDAKFFYYPRKGFGRIPERMAEEIVACGGRIVTSARPERIQVSEGRRVEGVSWTDSRGEAQQSPAGMVVSTIPLQALAALLQKGGGRLDQSIVDAAGQLQFRDLFLIYLRIAVDSIMRDQWIFFPEREFVFGRVFEQKQMSEETVPPDETIVACDFTDSATGPLSLSSDEELTQRSIDGLLRCGLLRDSALVRDTLVIRKPKFYPRYDLVYKAKAHELYGQIKQFDNLILSGRLGFYNYNNSDHCVDMAIQIREQLEQGRRSAEILDFLEDRVANYQIVD